MTTEPTRPEPTEPEPATEATEPEAAPALERVAPEPAVRTIDGTGHAAIPGMICTHDHVFQNLIKGIGDELEVWPIVFTNVRRATV